MKIENYIWYFESVIPPKICDDIIKHGNTKKEGLGITGDFVNGRDLKKKPLSKKEIKNLKSKRNSDVVWLDDAWIYKEIHPYIKIANANAGWNFQIDHSELCQFTKYKLNQYYDWHCDSFIKPYDNPECQNLYGKIRKISVTCQLSDNSEYKGGELEFDFRNNVPNNKDFNNFFKTTDKMTSKGSIIVFPSFVWHRVKPVTKGTRYSLVIWNLGYPFK